MKLDLEYMYDVLKENVYSECECKLNMCLSILKLEDYSDLWKKCSNYDEFYKCVMNQEEIDNLYVYLYLYGNFDVDPREKILDLFENRCFDIKSDDGEIFAGNDSCRTYISNDSGKGTTKIAVFNLDDPNRDLVRYAMEELIGRPYGRTRLIGKALSQQMVDFDEK